MPCAWRDVLLLLVGMGAGYAIAVTTRAASVPALEQARQYVMMHQMETFVFLFLVGVIVYLAGGKGGKR